MGKAGAFGAARQLPGSGRRGWDQASSATRLEGTLARGELNLVQAGESDAVLGLRRLWQETMRTSCSREVEQLTGRKVIGFMSDNHIDPDIAVEVFILEPTNENPELKAALAVADPAPA
jgi:uncharacterized protein YbcI